MSCKLLLVTLLIAAFALVQASPPKPPPGYKWVRNWAFSDEFNGNALDGKWQKFHPFWKGREPCLFDASTVSVSGGLLRIRNKWYNSPKWVKLHNGKVKKFTMGCGVITTKRRDARYGYYEARMKASKIMLGSAVFMSNQKQLLNATVQCRTDKYSQELDIIESVGAAGYQKWFYFRNNQMNGNTHYRHAPCGTSEEKYHTSGPHRKNLSTKTYEAFHVYGAWWRNAHRVDFYADNQWYSTAWIKNTIDKTNPFDRPMFVTMVTESYYHSTPYPNKWQLSNNDINTSYWDWFRAWYLVKQ